jgi:wyosine [tRNA(Phe)-imidazoG37] synthetase (radical SAM superfamily)
MTQVLSTMLSPEKPQISSVYGPVNSWRFGRSLGIDPIGVVSSCTFNCVYCQLGNIQQKTTERQIFVPTAQILGQLQAIAPWQYQDIDVVTLSGSGEPTLALNLGEILAVVKRITRKPTVVLTNSSTLGDRALRSDLALADIVAVKLDAVSSKQLQRINQAIPTIDLPNILTGIEQFRREYPGFLTIQTMVLSAWTPEIQANYTRLVQRLCPDEIQLQVPSRPRILVRQLGSRDNTAEQSRSYSCQSIKCISTEYVTALADKIHDITQIPVRFAPVASLY